MVIRALSSATVGLAVTTGLLYVMQFLIATGEEIIVEPRQRYFLDWVRPKESRDTAVQTRLPKKPDKPRLPPLTNLAKSTDPGAVGVVIPVATPLVRASRSNLTRFGFNDGPLINIFKVQPKYPVVAATRGLEGTVIVQFDVTVMGAVENVFVIDSTNRIFNKAAIEAAYRFRYKPRVVDGTRYEATGLRQLFRFEMEK